MTRASISSKLLRSNVMLVDAGCDKHLPHGRDHGGRPCDVVNRSSQVAQISRQHGLAYETRLTLPLLLGMQHIRHRTDEAETRVDPVQVLKYLQKRCILGPAVGVEEIQLVS